MFQFKGVPSGNMCKIILHKTYLSIFTEINILYIVYKGQLVNN
jgi:hypothetical protein